MNPSKTFVAALSLAALALQGCQTAPAPVAKARLPVYSTDLAGKAASCTAPGVKAVDGKETTAVMTTGGGGWCSITLNRDSTPYSAGVLAQAPSQGKVYVHTVGDDTRIDYTPYPGKSGTDAFAVQLLPGDAIVRVTVNISAAQGSK